MKQQRMEWSRLLTTFRFGMENYQNSKHDLRTEFQRDYDRMIFSAPFRRLQNKTQVFPLPGSVFVHNRLTHSLEVSSVGRSLGNNVVAIKSQSDSMPCPQFFEIGSIIAAACLAHDLGNPPFGHSGETAIGSFFSEGDGAQYKHAMSEQEWADFTHFDGNANAFRLLTHQFEGRRAGGFALTYSTLASVVKYPYESIYAEPGKQKFGFFQSERDFFKRIADQLGLFVDADDSNRYVRYPLVYLVEAADDICYQVMDIEDAYKLRILSYQQTKSLFMNFLTEERQSRAEEIFLLVSDQNEQIAYLRSSVIGELISDCSKTFVANEPAILEGTFRGSLIKHMQPRLQNAYQQASQVAVSLIYSSKEVIDVELSGYKIIFNLLQQLCDAVIHPEKNYSKQLLMRVSSQYDVYSFSVYGRLQGVLDYISGMTDVYALDLYRKINGISVPMI